MRRPRWNASEDDQLRRFVAAWGTKWSSLVRSQALPGRTEQGMEWRWSSLLAQGRSLETASGAGPSCEQVGRLPPCAYGLSTSAAGMQGVGSAEGAAPRYQGAKGSTMEPLRLDEVAGAVRADERRVGHGRGWTAALETPMKEARGAAPREKAKLREWGVSENGETRATVVPRAERMIARGTAAEDVHLGARQKLPTILASRAHVPIVSGCKAGGTRPMHPREGARLMGIKLNSGAWRAASAQLGEQALWEVMADGLDAHAVRVLWRNAMEMAEAAGCGLGGKVLDYAGMFAGGLDTIFTGGRDTAWVPGLRYVAVAEKCGRRRKCVGEAYSVPMAGRFKLASEMADKWAGRLDVLSVTPSCKKLSTAAHVKSGGAAAKRRKREGRTQLLGDVAAARKMMERCEPTVVMIEETACLHSHHSELYAELQKELGSWPYEWRHGVVDCAELGAAHHRRRALWVGLRHGARAAAAGES